MHSTYRGKGGVGVSEEGKIGDVGVKNKIKTTHIYMYVRYVG